jgi:hypothetical protein
MLVASDLLALLDHGIVNKLIEFGLPSLQDLLNDMITIDVLCQLPDSVLKVRREESNVLR